MGGVSTGGGGGAHGVDVWSKYGRGRVSMGSSVEMEPRAARAEWGVCERGQELVKCRGNQKQGARQGGERMGGANGGGR